MHERMRRSGVPSVESSTVAARVGGPSSPGTAGWHDGIAGGDGSASSRASRPAGTQGSAGPHGGSAPTRPADRWPAWARPQLEAAVAIAETIDRRDLAAELRRRWYAPDVADAEPVRGPLSGLYRRAHAGSAAPITADGVSILDCNDVIGRDGWWRTWGAAWTPTRSRATSVRILLSPRPDALAEFIGTLTAELLGAPIPWLLACTTDARRLRQAASAMLYVPDAALLAPELTERLRPLLRPASPPLCLPLAPGIAVSENPGNGMSFGAHRCHLVALGLRKRRRDPLRSIADAFAANGIDPAAPHRSARD